MMYMLVFSVWEPGRAIFVVHVLSMVAKFIHLSVVSFCREECMAYGHTELCLILMCIAFLHQ